MPALQTVREGTDGATDRFTAERFTTEWFTTGDVDAFETLFRQYQGEVYRWIVRIVRHPAVAEELTVETFWRIYRERQRFDAQRPFGPWARRIATCARFGIFGAVLPVLLVPAGVALAAALDLRFYTPQHAVVALPVAMAVYYLAWKYGVGFANRTVELR